MAGHTPWSEIRNERLRRELIAVLNATAGMSSEDIADILMGRGWTRAALAPETDPSRDTNDTVG
jgi:hypothetical protein